jgi:type VI secretion system protein ImpE
MTARQLYEAGKLKEAVAAATAEVKQAPADSGRRAWLCELLCFSGNLERADTQLDALGQVTAEAAMGVALFRQLVRAEQARQQFYSDGRLPEFLGLPDPVMKLHLEASVLLRSGQKREAADLLSQAEEQRVKPSGVCDGQPFTDFRDLDDLTASFFEVLTSNGKYYWIPMDRVDLIEFRPPARPRDLLWQRVHMVVRGGPDGEVFLPALYAGSHAEADEALALGRATDWRGGKDEPVRGIGQRNYLVGEDSRATLELKEVTFAGPIAG